MATNVNIMSTKKVGKASVHQKNRHAVEISYVLIGQVNDGIWHARLNWRRSGRVASVEFDWQRVLEREEKLGDVIGFFHTHPGTGACDGGVSPSRRDDKTMIAWSNCFGKPLLSVIEDENETAAWIYDYGRAGRTRVEKVVRFRSNWLVAVEQIDKIHETETTSRNHLSRKSTD